MGYSARYHVASLAAVFVALAVGILVGVGLGKNVVGGTTKNLEQSLKGNLQDERAHSADLESDLRQGQDFAQQIYPALVGGRLNGDRIAVIALGSLPSDLQSDIQAAAGATSPTGSQIEEIAVVRDPPDADALADAVGLPPASLRGGGDQLSRVAERAGRSLVEGGPAFRKVRDVLLSRFSGHPRGIDAVVVVRARPDDLSPADTATADSLESGVIAGLEKTGSLPVTGVERSDTDPSQIGFFESQGVPATVDSVDLVSGRVALVYVLAGAHGDYGVKDTADRLLPPLERPGSGRGK